MNKTLKVLLGVALPLLVSMDACVSDDAPITQPDSSTDDTFRPDVSVPAEAAVDAPSEADVVVEAGPTIQEIYVVAGGGGGQQSTPTSIEVIDIAQKKAVRDNTFAGIVALKYSGGSLYAVRGGGQTRISVIDPVTLNVTSTISLAWDPSAAAFSADGSTVYIARGAGFVEQVKLPAGSLTGEVQVPAVEGGTIQLCTGIALNNAESQIAATFNNGGNVNVATIGIAGTSLSVAHNIVPPGVDGSNCGRENGAVAYAADDQRVATFDTNCGTVDVYATSSLVHDDVASAQFARPNASGAGSIVYDCLAEAWAANYDTLYRAPTNNPSQKTAFQSSTLFWQVVFTDTTRATLFAITYDPHNNGIYTVAQDGGQTRELWDLSLIPANLQVQRAIYVER